MSVEILEEDEEWTTFLKTIPNASFYHSLNWRDIIQRTFNYTPLYLTIRDDLGKIAGICPGFIKNSMHFKIYDSIAWSDYGGPIIKDHFSSRGMLLLRNFLQEFCSSAGIDYAKICFLEESGARARKLYKLPLAYIERAIGVMEIDLKTTSSDLIWKQIYSGRLRKRIRRVEREKIQIQEAQTKSELLEFYNLYVQNMKYIGGSPDPYKLIKNMWTKCYPGNLRLWLLRKEKIIGAELFLQTEEGSYDRYLAIDTRETKNRLSLSYYLRWQEIRRADQEGRKLVSFGSTSIDPSSQHHIQKKRAGASFHPQEIIWYPFTSTGRILLQARGAATPIWKATRGFLPVGIKRSLESIFLKP
jgi:hypothetical protein